MDLARLVVAAEREVGGRRARDAAARWVGTALLADVLAVLCLLLPWTGGDTSGLQVSTGLSSALLVGIVLRQLVLRAVVARPDPRVRLAPALVTGLSLAGAVIAVENEPALGSRLAAGAGWGPGAFLVAWLAGGLCVAIAGRRMAAACSGVDLLAGLGPTAPEAVAELLHGAIDAALRRRAVRPAGANQAPRLAGWRGATRRLAVAAAAMVGIGLLVVPTLAWTVRATPAGSVSTSGWLAAPPNAIGYGVAALALALLLLHAPKRPDATLGTMSLVALVTAGAAGAAAYASFRRLDDAAAGPAPWLGLAAFGAAAGLALLAISALGEHARDERRRDGMEQARARLDEILPPPPAFEGYVGWGEPTAAG